jgi:ATP:corrinoid adenosyltransferase
MKEEQHLLIVLTGTGKGQTTPLGVAWRALGHRAKTAFSASRAPFE